MRPRTRLAVIGAFVAEAVMVAAAFLVMGGTAAVFVHARHGTSVISDATPPPAKFEAAVATAARPLAYAGLRRSATSRPPRALLPPQVLHAVPFSPQAPYGNWGNPYAEACEETSVAMVMAWANGAGALAPADADAIIRWLVAYEEYHFGYHEDTAVRETLKLITDSFRYPYARIEYASADSIRHELARGNVVLLPVAGAILANPFYGALPPYHMVVAVGYDEETREFIVHDPGTRRGEGFRYPYATIAAAIHDWTGSEGTLLTGAKRMIVVERPGRP